MVMKAVRFVNKLYRIRGTPLKAEFAAPLQGLSGARYGVKASRLVSVRSEFSFENDYFFCRL